MVVVLPRCQKLESYKRSQPLFRSAASARPSFRGANGPRRESHALRQRDRVQTAYRFHFGREPRGWVGTAGWGNRIITPVAYTDKARPSPGIGFLLLDNQPPSLQCAAWVTPSACVRAFSLCPIGDRRSTHGGPRAPHPNCPICTVSPLARSGGGGGRMAPQSRLRGRH